MVFNGRKAVWIRKQLPTINILLSFSIVYGDMDCCKIEYNISGKQKTTVIKQFDERAPSSFALYLDIDCWAVNSRYVSMNQAMNISVIYFKVHGWDFVAYFESSQNAPLEQLHLESVLLLIFQFLDSAPRKQTTWIFFKIFLMESSELDCSSSIAGLASISRTSLVMQVFVSQVYMFWWGLIFLFINDMTQINIFMSFC